jgi:hypothetical protein
MLAVDHASMCATPKVALIFMTTYVSHITHPEAVAGIAPLGAASACICGCLQGQHAAICKVPGTANGLLGNTGPLEKSYHKPGMTYITDRAYIFEYYTDSKQIDHRTQGIRLSI